MNLLERNIHGFGLVRLTYREDKSSNGVGGTNWPDSSARTERFSDISCPSTLQRHPERPTRPQRYGPPINRGNENLYIRIRSVAGMTQLVDDAVLNCGFGKGGVNDRIKSIKLSIQATKISSIRVYFRALSMVALDLTLSFSPTHMPRVCFKTIKVTKQGYTQGRQPHENRGLSSHIWWQNDDNF